ncbi:hypothetical protein [Rheinheimera baltica]|uniref:hypothetical protein n=1 Tax=Rheinheimera baltica TaxID=67576 RepID=UPI00273F6369|nr:hypothetical protein [Rheinheimera baltica]MDP5190767.1 hypothetical protein [Rheinheimera baltica]
MDTIKLLNLIPYTFLNPLILLAYFVVFSEDGVLHHLKLKPFYDLGGNCQRINLAVYLGFCVIASITFIAFKLLVLLPLASTPLTALDITLVKPGWRWLIAYVVTAITLGTLASRNGMEGNIAGFIFAPFIFISSLLLTLAHVQWLLAEVI